MNLSEYKAKPDKSIREHTNDVLKELDRIYEYGYIKDDEIYKLVKKSCELHDIGKVNKFFQKRVMSRGRIKFDESQEVPHNILSGFMIDKKEFISIEEYVYVLYAVLYHHNYVDVLEYIDESKDLIDKNLEEIQEGYKIGGRILNKLAGIIEDEKAIVIKGLLHKCDYSASAEIINEYKADFLENGLKTFLKDLRGHNQSKDVDWNDMQKYCINNQDNNILVVAQTGMGKTEGALNWIGDNKGFFILPLRTAINSIFKRIYKSIIKEENFKERIAILHSSSLAYYMNQEIGEDEELIEYEKLGKQWSMPLNITTMDQIFDFVFKYQGYELKLATLGYSKIVVDEIQMYDPILLAYLIYGLERIHNIGGKIAIVTATLPPFVEQLLKKNINFNDKKEFYEEEVIRHNLEVKNEKINSQHIVDKYIENNESGNSNKILVICNSIKKSVEVYEEIKSQLEEDVKLLHSRFIKKDREALEQEIVLFGETYNESGNINFNQGIWVSTSLVEASLDIDFDYIFTELQELSSLFQRLGRCNRKGVKSIAEPNCYIYTEIDDNIIKHGDKGFIDEKMYHLSKDAIKYMNGLLSEKDKMNLIKETFTTENVSKSDYMKAYKEAYNKISNIQPYKFDKNDIILRNIMSEDIIPLPVYENNKEEIDYIIDRLLQCSRLTSEKITLKDKLLKYTVSIPSYNIHNYEKAIIKGYTLKCPVLVYGRKEKIKVIDCEYDKRGFVQKDFSEEISLGGEFL